MFNLKLDLHDMVILAIRTLERKNDNNECLFFPLTKFLCLPADVDKEVEREIKTAKEIACSAGVFF